MSLSIVGKFQREIYKILLEEQQLKLHIKNIYIAIPKDANYPFLLINMVRMRDLSQYVQYSYEIEFDICIFEKDRNQERILAIADHIKKLITPNIVSIAEYQITSLKFIEAEWVKGQIPDVTKIILKFKSLIAGYYA